MSQVKRLLRSSKVRVTLALTIIAIAVVIAFFLPDKEQDPNIGIVNNPVTPTVGLANPVGSLVVNRSVDYRNLHITVTQVQEAGAFSDDPKPQGTYTVRVSVLVQPDASIKSPTGYKFASLAHLVLSNGEAISPKLVDLSPVVFPGQSQDGYFDFPVNTQVPLSSLSLSFEGGTTIAFSG